MAERHTILCLNSGSSSLKMALFESDGTSERRLASGTAEGMGQPVGQPLSQPRGRLRVVDSANAVLIDREHRFASHSEVLKALGDAPELKGLPRPEAVGHRVVHGGAEFTEARRVTPELRAQLRALIPLAPLHLPAQIEVMDFVSSVAPEMAQVACFDTAFHASMPEVARRLPLPEELCKRGVRKYGFHGLSFEYIVGELGGSIGRATVIAHLGNGCSLAALRDGQPMDTTMGLTPAGGLVMGTRTGDMDPGVLVYLLTEKGYDAPRLAKLIDKESGLLGISGTASDVRKLLESSAGDDRAALAIRMFCYSARKHIAAMAAALGGLDLLVFTGGIGEHAAPVRESICEGLGFMGIAIDREKNGAHANTISPDGSRCVVRVVPTNEDLMIARHTRRVVFG